MLATDALSAATTWRPQLFGDKRAQAIADPIIEPLWTGPRLLAFARAGGATLTDADGEPIDGRPEIEAALVEASGGATVLLEAVLTAEPIQAPVGIGGRDLVSVPKPAQAVTQMIVGSRGDRKDRIARHVEEAQKRQLAASSEPLALVAVDLVWLDDESLCDVPLLERKRILESVLVESELVRVGIHVKPPIDAWLGSWRAFGFRRMAYKAANSRYLPGVKNPDWALAEIPHR
ncbi:MAG TPA: hypothetical protein VFI34_00765 [Candidatus Limnocylindrales bacterium]|nr:hypothetical protein [Candidatus Limnocylindrales bacterium]